MIRIVLKNRSASDIMDIVKDLRKSGYQQSVDFDFAYHPGSQEFSYHDEKYTEFVFYKDSLATLFTLKYS